MEIPKYISGYLSCLGSTKTDNAGIILSPDGPICVNAGIMLMPPDRQSKQNKYSRIIKSNKDIIKIDVITLK